MFHWLLWLFQFLDRPSSSRVQRSATVSAGSVNRTVQVGQVTVEFKHQPGTPDQGFKVNIEHNRQCETHSLDKDLAVNPTEEGVLVADRYTITFSQLKADSTSTSTRRTAGKDKSAPKPPNENATITAPVQPPKDNLQAAMFEGSREPNDQEITFRNVSEEAGLTLHENPSGIVQLVFTMACKAANLFQLVWVKSAQIAGDRLAELLRRETRILHVRLHYKCNLHTNNPTMLVTVISTGSPPRPAEKKGTRKDGLFTAECVTNCTGNVLENQFVSHSSACEVEVILETLYDSVWVTKRGSGRIHRKERRKDKSSTFYDALDFKRDTPFPETIDLRMYVKLDGALIDSSDILLEARQQVCVRPCE